MALWEVRPYKAISLATVSADINFGLNVSVGWKKLANDSNVGCRKYPFRGP